MLTVRNETRLLQIIVALACLVPLSAGFSGALTGVHLLGIEAQDADRGQHFRYLSGLLLGIGLAFAGAIPRIERQGARFRILTFIVLIGGLSRLWGFIETGRSGWAFWLPIMMELVVTPGICIWQMRIETRWKI